jgi:hypothetical protein
VKRLLLVVLQAAVDQEGTLGRQPSHGLPGARWWELGANARSLGPCPREEAEAM